MDGGTNCVARTPLVRAGFPQNTGSPNATPTRFTPEPDDYRKELPSRQLRSLGHQL